MIRALRIAGALATILGILVLGVGSAIADEKLIRMSPYELTFKTGDTGKTIVTATLGVAPSQNITVPLSLSGDDIAVLGKTTLSFGPGKTSDQFGVTLKNKNLTTGKVFVNAKLTAADGTLYTGTMTASIGSSTATGGSGSTTSNPCGPGLFKPGFSIAGGADCVNFGQYFTSLVNLAIGVAIAVSIGILVYAGIIYAQSQGEASKISLAKELVGGVVTGLAILLLIKLILPTLGIKP